ncbi:RsmE family RNA methyltransferase [Candidatus Dependentiae bacterium]|nr:RsmE family RNA methyltransferase [Candidatus Dependentiae bacterium]
MKNEQHIFFIHEPALDVHSLSLSMNVTCTTATSYRIATILRLRTGESVCLFNNNTVITLLLKTINSGKKCLVEGTITDIKIQTPLLPQITLFCGMTKTSTFEEICYSATQLGVSDIIPVKTEKSYTKSYTEKDYLKFYTQSVAAAEQSKQLFLPKIHPPTTISELQKSSTQWDNFIFFEADGAPFSTIISNIKKAPLFVFFGPEGGLSHQEQQELTALNAKKSSLCRPILKSQDAVLVAIGALRSLI